MTFLHLGTHYNRGIWLNCRPWYSQLATQYLFDFEFNEPSDRYHHLRSPRNFERFTRKTATLWQKVRANRNYYEIRLNRGKVHPINHRKATSRQYQLANPKRKNPFIRRSGGYYGGVEW